MPSILHKKRCVPCEGGAKPLSPDEVKKYLAEVPEWHADPSSSKISRTWKFKNFIETMAFLNRVAEIAESENHHPDMHASYNKVMLELSTHAIGGLSESDFILAAKIDALR